MRRVLVTGVSDVAGGHRVRHASEEMERSLRFKDTVEPRLPSIAHAEIDTTAPLGEVVAAILALVRTPA